MRDLKVFAVEREQRAPAGRGRIVGANRVGTVATKGRLAGGDRKRGALEPSEDSDRTWAHGSSEACAV